MSTINGKSYQDPRNINLKGGALGTGLLRFSLVNNGGIWSSNPFSTDDAGLYINASGQLVYSYLNSTTILGGSGSGATPTWEQIFAADATFSKTTAWTIDNTSLNNNVLLLTNSGGGSGQVIQITNAGTGKDIRGTASTWAVTKLGVATFTNIDSPLITSSAALTIAVAGAGVLTLGTGSNTITAAVATTFSSTVTVTDGVVTLADTSNVTGLLYTSSATTAGVNTASTGAAVFRSSTLMTGTLLKLQLTEGTLTTGWYLNCYDVTTSGSVFSIGKYGALVQGGNGGTTIQTITAGDFLMSDGSITVTDADNAASLSVTNDTATSASVIAFAGSGVFAGNTTSSFVTITPSGMTTGTALYIPAAAATTSVAVVDIIGAALTSGSLLRLTTSTAAFATGGKALEIALVAATAGNGMAITTTGAYTGTGLAILTAGAMTTGVLLQLTSTTGLTSGSLLRATSSTAGIIATNGAVSITATGAFTTAVAVGFVNITANTTTAGYIMDISGTSLTTGVALSIANGTSGLTTGSLIRVSASGTGTVATNGIVSFNHAGVFGSTSNAGFVNITANATTQGTVLAVNATALVDGVGIFSPSAEAGLTTGKYMSLGGGKFTIAKYGATVIAGNAAGTSALTLTAGDLTLTSGHLVMTAGNATLTLGNLTLTAGNLVLTLGNATLTSGNLILSSGNASVVGSILSSSPSGGVGYATGAGSTVTQTINRATGVTINAICGKIQTDTTSLAAGASAEFTVTNSSVAIGDVVVVSQRSGSSNVAGVAGTTYVNVVTVAGGSFVISVDNKSTTTAETGAIIINFAVIKAVTA